LKILLTEEQVRESVRRMAAEIAAFYGNRPLTIVGILTGSLVLLADLIRQLEMPLRVGVVQASSYRGATTTRGPLVMNADLMLDVAGHDVLLIDDIYDTGHTLSEMMTPPPQSIRSVVLLRKEGRQEIIDPVPDHVGFRIPDEFVVGYGLDYQDAYRNLPYVATLEEDELVGVEEATLSISNGNRG